MRSKVLALIAAAGGFAWSAIANAAPPAAPVAYNWTGLYIGANVGYGIGRNPATLGEVTPSTFNHYGLWHQSPAGMLAGGQVGYNQQFAPHWVAGIEADWQWANQKDSTCVIQCSRTPGPVTTHTIEQKLESFGTLRARLGYAADHWLLYATGGFAWGQLDQAIIRQTTNIGISTGAVSTRHQLRGWTAGGGIEVALADGWSSKLEYLYAELGGASDTLTVAGPSTYDLQSTVRNHIIRTGVNYRGLTATPRTAPTRVHDWTGFHIGANAGYGIGRNPTSGSAYLTLSRIGAIFDSTEDVPIGALGGVQIGYDRHVAPNWVVGVEADWQWANQRSRKCFAQCGPTGDPGQVFFTVEQALQSFGTARARVGYAENRFLAYATGGFAWAQVEQAVAGFASFPGFAGSASSRHQVNGWTAGGGIEVALAGDWSAKAEYLYMRFGDIRDRFFGSQFDQRTFDSSVRNHVVRAGLNYRFAGI